MKWSDDGSQALRCDCWIQAGRLASEQVESAVAAAEDGFKDGNTLEATAKAAVAAWRSAQVIYLCDLPLVAYSFLSLQVDL